MKITGVSNLCRVCGYCVTILVFLLTVSCHKTVPGEVDAVFLPKQPNCEGDCAEILWDDWGVPHIYSSSQQSAFYGLGWVQMRNHGSLLLTLYAQARGRAAEYLDESYIDSDIMVHELGIPETAVAWLAQQDKDYVMYLAAFAKGINDYAVANPDALDADLKAVLPVTSTDLLAHTLRIIHYKFVSGDAIFDAYSAMGYGSNGIAISPQRTVGKRSMLLINPHLPWSDYFTWMEAHIISPEVNAYGVALVGAPYLGIAITPGHAWTHTVNPVDGADQYQLVVDNNRYLFDGRWLEFEEDLVTIKIKNTEEATTRDFILKRRRSVHGPLVSRYGENVALRVVGLDAPQLVKQYWDMAGATGFESFRSVISRMQMPFFNTLYADKEGDIFYFYGAREPNRRFGTWAEWRKPQPGDSSDYLWQDTMGIEAIPQLHNPASGFIQNANDSPWTNTYPFELNAGHYSPRIAPPAKPSYRAQRALSMLLADTEISFEELSVIRADTQVESAMRFLDDLLLLAKQSSDEAFQPVVAVLEKWNRRTDSDSRGAVLFLEWFTRMNRDFSDSWIEDNWDPHHPLSTPRGIVNPDQALSYLKAASEYVKQQYGQLDVAYGSVYRIRHQGQDIPASVGLDTHGIFRVGYFRKQANGLSHLVGGQSFVSIVEYTEPYRAKAILPYGNSTETLDRPAKNQLELFADGLLRDVYFSRNQVQKHLQQRDVISLRY